MVLYHVYSQEYRVRYLAHPCSTATVFQTICVLFTFLPPLFIAYFTSGFYYKELTYTAQPNVSFLQRYNVILESSSALLFTSSDHILNQYFQSTFIPSTLRSTVPEDLDGDGMIDRHTLTIEIPLQSSIAGQRMQLWLIFRTSLNQYPSIDMETLAVISLNVPSSPPPASSHTELTVYGQLQFRQRKPILSYENDSSIQNPIMDYGTYAAVPSFDEILANYDARNYSTVFKQQYVQWSSASGSNPLTIRVVVTTGQQLIRYVPSFWKEFRWSWIQYFSVLLPFVYVMNKVKEFTFTNGLVRTVVRNKS